MLADLFNVFDFPNNKSDHPTRAYMSKAEVLNAYLENDEAFKKLRPILQDILTLHDTVSSQARDKYNDVGRAAKIAGGAGAKGGSLSFVETKKRGPLYTFPFIGGEGSVQLAKAALLPMLAAFRWMVEFDPKTGLAKWRGGFSSVLKTWDSVAGELMKRTQQTNVSVGRQANAIGRNAQHWAQLYDFLARAEMQMNSEAQKAT